MLVTLTGERDQSRLSRRDFLRITSLSAAGVLAGCASNPVTGESELMLVSESQEIQIDKQNSPHQGLETFFSQFLDVISNMYTYNKDW